MENADPAVKQLAQIAYDEKQSAEIRLKATLALIDRAGLSPRQALEIEVGPSRPYETIFESIESGSRAEHRRSMGIADDSDTVAKLARELAPADADDALDVEIIDAEPITPDGPAHTPADDTAPEFSPFGGPPGSTGPASSGLMSLEDAVAAQAEMRRAAAWVRPVQRALPRGRSDR
jgi:hypothetical protein